MNQLQRAIGGVVVAASLVLSTIPALAVAPQGEISASADGGRAIAIPESTKVTLKLEQTMRSGDIKPEAEVRFAVAKDITDDDGRLLIRAGTPAYGRVTKSKHHAAFGAPGKLEFTCDYLQIENGPKVPLRQAAVSSYGRDNRAATVATAVLISPVALFIQGRDVTIKRGTEYVMYVDKTTSLNGPDSPHVTPGSFSAGKSVFLTRDGKAYVGRLIRFDGTTYTVATDSRTVTLKASDVQSVTPVVQ